MVVEDRQEHEPGDLGHSYQFVLEFKYGYGMIENKYGKNKKSSMEKIMEYTSHYCKTNTRKTIYKSSIG